MGIPITKGSMEDKEEKDHSSADEEKQMVPPLTRWSNVMDDIIDEAIRDGFFDDLPGKGKPLNLTKNPFSADTELAHELLKANDYTLPWIAERAALLEAIAGFRGQINQTWTTYRKEYDLSKSETISTSLALGWDRHIHQWSSEIRDINKRISEANLKLPGQQLEIMKLNLDSELARYGADRELK